MPGKIYNIPNAIYMDIKTFFEFFFLSDPNVRNVVIGCSLISVTSSIVGCFTFLRKRALIGDAVAHSVLPGVCLAFILSGAKNPVVILLGAFITGWLSVYLTDYIVRNSKLKEDTAIGLMLSVSFGIGILLLTSIQHSGNAQQSGLDSFIFGKAASLVEEDLYVFGGTSIIILFTVYVLFKEFMLLTFDRSFAQAIGLPIKKIEFALTTVTVLAVITGIQAVGVVLMAAMLITPAAAARFWTNKITLMIALAAGIGFISGISGTFISYISPSMPTGPWIVVIVSIIAAVSFFVAPEKGTLFRFLLQKKNKKKIIKENILKALYHLGEQQNDFFSTKTIQEISDIRELQKSQLMMGLKLLKSEGYIIKKDNGWMFTQQGKDYGMRVARLHRLWEVYISKYLHLASDHVHDDAENIEHIITPEIEKKIYEELNYPPTDPHDSVIPYNAP